MTPKKSPHEKTTQYKNEKGGGVDNIKQFSLQIWYFFSICDDTLKKKTSRGKKSWKLTPTHTHT